MTATPAEVSGRRGASRFEVMRFLVVGGANTAVTTIAFYGLSFLMPVTIAFSVSYLGGLVFVAYATPRLVFGTTTTRARRAMLVSWYLVVYLCGLVASALLDGPLGASRALVVIGTLAVTAPLGFVGSQWIVARPKR